ncbi:site-specific integrase [archaeon]|nr:site-specific integrase [archaeon]
MKRPWSQQNKLKEKEIPSHSDIIITASNIEDLRTRSLFILLYFTAGRASEICCGRDKKGEVIDGIKKKDLELTFVKGRTILLIKTKNLKNKNRKYKYIPVPVDKEDVLLAQLNQYLGTLHPNQMLFPFAKHRAYQLIKPATGYNPHWIRHIRLTHLIKYYNLPDQLITRFAGWTDSRPAKHYIELRWQDIVDHY